MACETGRLTSGQTSSEPFASEMFASRNQRGWVRSRLGAEAFARGTPTESAVEREIVRVERIETAATFFASEMLAVNANLPTRLRDIVIWVRDMHDTFAEGQCVFDAARDAGAGVWSHDDTIDEDFDIVLSTAIDGRCFR